MGWIIVLTELQDQNIKFGIKVKSVLNIDREWHIVSSSY